MTNVVYSKPTIEKVASFKESTKGIWIGAYRDLLGAKTPIKVKL
ncbi:lasso RiPP family leader peptide-containing protein [Paenibacillus thiaminolyticus]|nr:lasso RiPP family leader peptide-containing protein [Paenibacillus thiaminolyticus]